MATQDLTVPTTHRSMPRRSVLAKGAWATPAVALAAAAPATAASLCGSATSTRTLNWGTNYVRNSYSTTAAAGTATLPAVGLGGTPLTVGVSTVTVASGTLRTAALTAAASGTFGGVAGIRPLQLATGSITTSTLTGRNNFRQDTTFTFSRPVTNLQVSIVDLDGSAIDTADVTPGFTQTFAGSEIQGVGTIASPWRRNTDGDVSNALTNTTVRFTYVGPITQFTIFYYVSRVPTSTIQQTLYIPPFSFTATNC